MKGPDIRDALKAAADRLALLAVELQKIDAEVRMLAEATRRRSPIRRAPTQRNPVTPKVKKAVRLMAHMYPDMPFDDIGEHFHIDGGRVSEIVRGKRT
jgi:hypothetical protein